MKSVIEEGLHVFGVGFLDTCVRARVVHNDSL